MSLLSEAMTACTRLVRMEQPDGYGGVTTIWGAGDPIQAAIVYISEQEGRPADKDGVVSSYYVITPRATVLAYNEVVQRGTDGKIFLITSDGEDEYTPASAGLDMRCVTAREWSLTDNG